MKRKGQILVFLVLALVVVGIPFWKVGIYKKNADSVRIGAILPLTGDLSSYAIQLKKGMDLALEQYNDTAKRKIDIVFEDDKGEAKNAVSSYRKLVDIDGINLIIGGMFSASTLAIAPAAEKEHVVLLSPTASAIELTEAGDYIFRIYPSDIYDGVFLSKFVSDSLDAKRIAVVYEQVSSVSTITEKFIDGIVSDGRLLVYKSGYSSEISDFTSILMNVKRANPDVVFIPGNIVPVANILIQAERMGLACQFVTISTAYDHKIIELAKSAADGLIFSTPMFDTGSDSFEISYFCQQYKQKYNEEPDILGGYGYDVVNIAIASLSNGMCADDIKTSLYGLLDYPGVTGNTSFDINGDVVKELKIMTVKNGEFVNY